MISSRFLELTRAHADALGKSSRQGDVCSSFLDKWTCAIGSTQHVSTSLQIHLEQVGYGKIQYTFFE